MIACFLKKVHEQNQKKIGKKYGVLVMYFKYDMCYKIIKNHRQRSALMSKRWTMPKHRERKKKQ